MNIEIQKERNNILLGFRKLGFGGITAFYNVCKSIDVTLNGFQLLEFYRGTAVYPQLVTSLYTILEKLKYE